MPNYKLTLNYDGSRYKGWQRQGNTDNTIQAKMETLLSRLLEQEVEIAASGRTDAGVHARMQVCSFRAETNMPTDVMLTKLREHTPEDIGILSIEQATPRFHARLNCIRKSYVYQIWNSDEPNVFQRKYMYAYPEKLDIEAMQQAAEQLIGEHDFSAFCTKRMKKSAVRRLEKISIHKEGNIIKIMLTGNGFLYNMVRIIVGTLLEVGTGRRSVDSVGEALHSMDRQNAGFTAPPQGLFLWDVEC
jgi:tRNA pseudouridine38-40 synthase